MYFPNRVIKTRPYLQEAMDQLQKGGSPDLQGLLFYGMQKAFGDIDKTTPLVQVCRANEFWLLSSMGRFNATGQVIIQLEPTLREAFRTSELGDATARDLKFPHEAFYLHIGVETGLTFNDGQTQLEGVIVNRSPVHQEVELTLVGTLLKEPEHWGLRGLETFTLGFDKGSLDTPLLEAAKVSIQKMADIKGTDISDLSPKDQDEVKAHWAMYSEAERLSASNESVALECVRLVANALLYLAQYPEDLVDGYQPDFPKAFIAKIERSEGKTRERTLSKARAQGFTLIKRLGTVFEEYSRRESEETGGGNGPAPHLRRAHWRRQAYGPQGSLRKLMWIRAARVLGGEVREREYLIKG